MKIKEVVNQDKFRNKIRLDVFKKILKDNLDVNDEKLLIIGDKGLNNNLISPILTNAYSLAARDLGLKFETVYQNFKMRRDEADLVLLKKLKDLPKRSVLVINISNRIGGLGSLGGSLRTFAKDKQHRFVSSSSLGSISNKNLPLLVDCLDIDYEAIARKTRILADKLNDAREINVTTKLGTDLTFNVEGMPGKEASGLYREPGSGGNLPGSEAYIAPVDGGVDGVVFIDGSLRVKNKTLLLKEPVRLDVTKGSIVSMSNGFEANQLLDTLTWAQKYSVFPRNVWKISELGIGLNKNAKIIGSTIIDEKTYGTAHIATGSNHWFGGNVKSFIHLDHVFKDPVFKIDGRLLKY